MEAENHEDVSVDGFRRCKSARHSGAETREGVPIDRRCKSARLNGELPTPQEQAARDGPIFHRRRKSASPPPKPEARVSLSRGLNGEPTAPRQRNKPAINGKPSRNKRRSSAEKQPATDAQDCFKAPARYEFFCFLCDPSQTSGSVNMQIKTTKECQTQAAVICFMYYH